MVPDEDEFANFSDDEIAVTLSLDNFSISSRHNSTQIDNQRNETVSTLSQHRPIDNEAIEQGDHQTQKVITVNDKAKTANGSNTDALPICVGNNEYDNKMSHSEDSDMMIQEEEFEYSKCCNATESGCDSVLEETADNLGNKKTTGKHSPLSVIPETSYRIMKLLTKEEDVMVCRQTPVNFAVEYIASKPVISNNRELPNKPIHNTAPKSEYDIHSNEEEYDDVFEDYSDYSDDSLDLETDGSDNDSSLTENKMERRPSLDADKRTINQLNEIAQLDKPENIETIGKSLFSDRGYQGHDTVYENEKMSQYSETNVLNHVSDLNTEPAINNQDSLQVHEESVERSNVQHIQAGRAAIFLQCQSIDTKQVKHGDKHTNIGNGHGELSRRVEPNNLLDKSHLHSTSASSYKVYKEVMTTASDVSNAVLPRRRSNSHTQGTKEKQDKVSSRQDYTVEIIKLRKEKARKMKQIYEKSSLERKRHLLTLKEKSQSKAALVNRRKSSSASLKSSEGAPSNIRNNFTKFHNHTEITNEFTDITVQVKQKEGPLLYGNGIDRKEGKPKPPLNINAFHNQILAINSKSVKEYTQSAMSQQTKLDVFTVGRTERALGDKISNRPPELISDISTSNGAYHKTCKSVIDANMYSSYKDKASFRFKPDKIERKHRVPSKRPRTILKVDAGATHVSRLSTSSWADDDKGNYNRDISVGNLLHEDYTSGNCNINTSSERYDLPSSSDNFSKNDRINTVAGHDKLSISSDRHSVVHGAPCSRHRTRSVDTRPECSSKTPEGTSKAELCHYNAINANNGQCNVKASQTDHSVTMSGKLRQRNSSGLADLARLQDIRRELLLTESEVDDAILHGDVFTNESLEKQHAKRLLRKNETLFIVQEILSEVIRKVFRNRSGYRNSELRQKRYTTENENGAEVLCCVLQAPCDKIDLSSYSCELLDPLDVPRVTGKHELLISNIIQLTAVATGQAATEPDLVAIVPIVDDYVAPWQEVVIKELDSRGKWVDNGEPADMINIDDGGKIVHSVQLLLKDETSVAVIARPKTNCIPLGNQSMTVTSSADPRVQMRVPASSETDGMTKHITLQVVPIEHSLLTEFRNARYLANDIDVTAATSLIVMTLTGQNPETVSFIAKCLKTLSGDELYRGETTSVRYKGCQMFRERINQLQSLKPPQHVPVPRQTPSPRPPKNTGHNDRKASKDMHLVQIGDDSEVRLKLLEDSERMITENGRDHTVKFSVYDKSVRLLALETRSGLQYAEIQRLAKSFTDFVVKHRVKLRVGQDTRNIYSVHFSMTSYLPYRNNTKHRNKEPISSTHLSTYLQIEEGDLVGVVFRGNIDVLNQTQRVYSFHGYRGINQTFDIQVGDTFSQRSLQSFHGGVKIFTLKGPRYSAIDKMALPSVGTNWELRAEFPLVLPKFMKKTPVTINKAPVSLRFQEPLTVDYISKICTDLVDEWEEFAAALGISHARIQSIKQQNRNVISERMLMDIVVCWMKQQPISRNKVGPLMHALTSCGKWKLAAELGKRYDSTCTHRSHTTKGNDVAKAELDKQYNATSIQRSQTTRDKKLQRSIALVCKSKHVTCKWKQLYCHLSHDDKSEEQLKKNIAVVESKYETDATRCYRALCRWKAESTSAPSVWNLVDALRSCQCSTAAESLTVIESNRV